MKKFEIGIIAVATLGMGSVYAWTRLVPEVSPEAVEGERIVGPDLDLTERRHVATSRMIEAGERASGTAAPEFEAPANDGKSYRLSEISRERPMVLIFIKDGCPCSRSADQFLQRLHAAGRGWVPFYGVIDGGVMVAEKWAEQTHSVFPILADPELKIIHAFGAESSAYVAFIGPGGRIERLWAGYSETMLRELGERMARWVKPGMESFDVTDAPADLYAGCPY